MEDKIEDQIKTIEEENKIMVHNKIFIVSNGFLDIVNMAYDNLENNTLNNIPNNRELMDKEVWKLAGDYYRDALHTYFVQTCPQEAKKLEAGKKSGRY